MAATSRLLSSAVVGFLLVGGSATSVGAQVGSRPAARPASFAAGSIQGVVQDEQGEAIAGVVVSALGATTAVAVTDKEGRFDLGTLSPGPYLVRAHHGGFVAPRPRTVQLGAGARATAQISLRRVGAPVLAAGFGLGAAAAAPQVPEPSAPDVVPAAEETGTVWRLRHARRSVLKEATIPSQWFVDAPEAGFREWMATDVLGRALDSARAASNFFTDTPFSGQLNLMTSGSFDTTEQLLSPDNIVSNIAYVSLGAPLGAQADWAVRGAITQSDISSWTFAGSYATRAPAAHRQEFGVSYAAQRYDRGNPLALRDMADGSRSAGSVYAYDSLSLSQALTVTYGGALARYDYLGERSLFSPRIAATLSPTASLRINALLARRALAPGAEEFLPPSDSGLWLPPQRTFSAIERDRPFEAERTTHAEATIERDFGGSTVAVRAFRQHVDGQLATVFGAELPGRPVANPAHYFVGTAGDAVATGYAVGFRTLVASRVRGAVEYTLANAALVANDDTSYLMLLAPSTARPARERLHDLTTSLETDVPETATRIVLLYRVSNGFARQANDGRSPAAGGRFDVQVRQQLPFMNFSNARWEMLIAVRNFFRESAADQSLYDELLVVRPPKRVVGGVTLRF